MTPRCVQRCVTSFVLVVGSIAATPIAVAAGGEAQAEALFRQGKALLAAGKTAEACAAFEESQKVDPTVSTLLNEASCREKNGQLASAWGLFLDAERQTRGATDAPTMKLHKVAVDHAARLEPHVPKLIVSVPPESRIERLEILRNRDPVPEPFFNHPIPIDGGRYKVTARAPEMVEWSIEVAIGAKDDAKTVDVPKLVRAPISDAPAASTNGPAALAPAPATIPPGPVLSTPAPATGQTPVVMASAPAPVPHSKVVPLALAGGAAAALVGALAFDLWGNSTYNQAKNESDPAQQNELWQSANDRRYVAEGLVAVGVGCGVASLWLYLRGDKERDPGGQSAHVDLVPIFESGRAGVVVSGMY